MRRDQAPVRPDRWQSTPTAAEEFVTLRDKVPEPKTQAAAS